MRKILFPGQLISTCNVYSFLHQIFVVLQLWVTFCVTMSHVTFCDLLSHYAVLPSPSDNHMIIS